MQGDPGAGAGSGMLISGPGWEGQTWEGWLGLARGEDAGMASTGGLGLTTRALNGGWGRRIAREVGGLVGLLNVVSTSTTLVPAMYSD